MNPRRVILAAFLLCLVGESAGAAVPMQGLGVSAGAFKPMSDFGDVADMGFAVGIVSCRMLSPQFGLTATADLKMADANADANSFLQDTFGDPTLEEHFSVLSATFDGLAVVPMEGTVTPYLKGGVGLYQMRFKFTSDYDADLSTTETHWGVNVGGGFLVQTSEKLHLGLQAVYHIVPDSESKVNYNMLVVSANLLFGLGQ